MRLMDDADVVARAFDLGRPVGNLELIQVSSFETWRLRTSSGSYLVKRLWQGDAPDWWREHEAAMQFERRAIEAGIRTARPVDPVQQVFGWAAQAEDFGTVRVYEWVDSRALTADDDITTWLGQTLATLHHLAPLGPGFGPQWRWLGIYDRERWEVWVDLAQERHKPWAHIARKRLPYLTAFSNRVREAYEHATDHTTSHRDVGPWNVLVAERRRLLIDWESVGPVIASCEAGRAIQAFSHGNPAAMQQLRDAYVAAGGAITCAPRDFMLDLLTDLLAQITERIRLMIDDYPDPSVPMWMQPSTADRAIADDLERFPVEEQRLTDLGTRLLQS